MKKVMNACMGCVAILAASIAFHPVRATEPVGEKEQAERVAAFARLYGVVRYFYPGDAIQSLDWNKFAVYGTQRVREAKDSVELGETLESLFAPLASGVLVLPQGQPYPRKPVATASEKRVMWQYVGYATDVVPLDKAYQGKRTHRPGIVHINRWQHNPVVLAQRFDAQALRGKTLRFSARFRVQQYGGEGEAWLQLQPLGPGQAKGVTVSGKRDPARAMQWQRRSITASIDATTEALNLSVVASRGLQVDVADVRLEQRNPDGHWRSVEGLKPVTDEKAWPFVNASSGLERKAMTERGGERWLRLQKPGGKYAAPEHLLYPLPAESGRVVDFALDDQWKARVPLDLSDRQAKMTPSQQKALAALGARLSVMPDPAIAPLATSARQADIVVAWNAMRHFYPYWVDLDVDWDARLIPLLRTVVGPGSRSEQRDTLRALLAELQDGHANATDRRETAAMGRLPITVEPMGKAWVVVASASPEVEVGDVLTSIGALPIEAWKAREMALSSGSSQWRNWRAINALQFQPAGGRVALELDRGNRRATATLTYDPSFAEPERRRRPDAITELEPGIWYVDITRADGKALELQLAMLASAKAIIFDLRGYPRGDVTLALMPRLLERPEHARWMHIASYSGPFGELAKQDDLGWDMAPKPPHLGGRIVFLTDGRAISQADSVLAYVAEEKIGDIVGSTSAGANGDINIFDTPTGYLCLFSGLRVTRHDGHSRFHVLGTPPTVAIEPTVAGFRAGRDEVLDRALRQVR